MPTKSDYSAVKFILRDEIVLNDFIALVDDVRGSFTIGMTEQTNDKELADVLRYKGAHKFANLLIDRMKRLSKETN